MLRVSTGGSALLACNHTSPTLDVHVQRAYLCEQGNRLWLHVARIGLRAVASMQLPAYRCPWHSWGDAAPGRWDRSFAVGPESPMVPHNVLQRT